MEVRVWTEEAIVDLLMKDDLAVARAILALYARQTDDEQSSEEARHHNGQGFSSADAPFLSSIAKALPRYKNHMTPKQLRAARKILPRYRRQLLEIAHERAASKPAPVVAPQHTVGAIYGRF